MDRQGQSTTLTHYTKKVEDYNYTCIVDGLFFQYLILESVLAVNVTQNKLLSFLTTFQYVGHYFKH